MEASNGDRVVIEGAKVGQARRSGKVVGVEGTTDHRRLWVQWEDGHQSLLVPDASVRIEPHDAPRKG